jgi:hypothetical protein
VHGYDTKRMKHISNRPCHAKKKSLIMNEEDTVASRSPQFFLHFFRKLFKHGMDRNRIFSGYFTETVF